MYVCMNPKTCGKDVFHSLSERIRTFRIELFCLRVGLWRHHTDDGWTTRCFATASKQNPTLIPLLRHSIRGPFTYYVTRFRPLLDPPLPHVTDRNKSVDPPSPLVCYVTLFFCFFCFVFWKNTIMEANVCMYNAFWIPIPSYEILKTKTITYYCSAQFIENFFILKKAVKTLKNRACPPDFFWWVPHNRSHLPFLFCKFFNWTKRSCDFD